jgi:hypothetical protein
LPFNSVIPIIKFGKIINTKISFKTDGNIKELLEERRKKPIITYKMSTN